MLLRTSEYRHKEGSAIGGDVLIAIFHTTGTVQLWRRLHLICSGLLLRNHRTTTMLQKLTAPLLDVQAF